MSPRLRRIAPILVALFASVTAAPALAACPGESFVGLIDFTTRVTGAKSTKSIGVNGYYRMRVSMGAGCQIRVDLVKLGFNKIMFSKDKLQWGSFGARAYQVPDGNGNDVEALFVDAALRSNSGSELDMAITLLDGVSFSGGAAGFWRHLGKSWEQAGMWGGLQWARSAENGPYAVSNKIACDSLVTTTSALTVAAFDCNGFFVASYDLSRALLAGAAGVEGAYSFGKIATQGTLTDGGVYWDVCVDNESDSGPGPKAGWVTGFRYSPSSGASSKEPDVASWKRCGLRAPEPTKPATPRWQGGIR